LGRRAEKKPTLDVDGVDEDPIMFRKDTAQHAALELLSASEATIGETKLLIKHEPHRKTEGLIPPILKSLFFDNKINRAKKGR